MIILSHCVAGAAKTGDLEFDLDDDLTEEERKDIIESYQPEIDEIKERIADLKEELDEI